MTFEDPSLWENSLYVWCVKKIKGWRKEKEKKEVKAGLGFSESGQYKTNEWMNQLYVIGQLT